MAIKSFSLMNLLLPLWLTNHNRASKARRRQISQRPTSNAYAHIPTYVCIYTGMYVVVSNQLCNIFCENRMIQM